MMNYWAQKTMKMKQWKIGFFDSWSGWLFTLIKTREHLPTHDYILYADIKNLPYGEKTADLIESYTFHGLNRLFDHWCELVIIACNTASAYSIRKRQTLYPNKKVLSVTIPLVEEISKNTDKNISILCTKATKQSQIIPDLFKKNNISVKTHIIECPWLADIIESKQSYGYIDQSIQEIIIHSYFQNYHINSEIIALACTHYGMCLHWFQTHFKEAFFIDTSLIVPQSISNYLIRHPEIESQLSHNGNLEVFWNH